MINIVFLSGERFLAYVTLEWRISGVPESITKNTFKNTETRAQFKCRCNLI